MTTPTQIHTDRLLLRSPTVDDAPAIFVRYARDPEVCRYLSFAPHQSIADTLAYLNRIVGDNGAGRSHGFLIFSRASGDLLGSIGGAVEQHRLQFGYCLARDAWGRGYSTEAALAFVGHVIKLPSILRVQAYCDVGNRASARVLEKIGLSLEGTLRRYLVLPNLGTAPRDVFIFAKVREAEGERNAKEATN